MLARTTLGKIDSHFWINTTAYKKPAAAETELEDCAPASDLSHSPGKTNFLFTGNKFASSCAIAILIMIH